MLVDEFCLYLWRSLETPGILYLARSLDRAQAVYRELTDEGYLVKVVHSGTDTEYEMRNGALSPVNAKPKPISISARPKFKHTSTLGRAARR